MSSSPTTPRPTCAPPGPPRRRQRLRGRGAPLPGPTPQTDFEHRRGKGYLASVTDVSARPAGSILLDDLAGPRRRHLKEGAIRAVFFAAALVSIAISVLIMWSLAREAWTFIAGVDWGSTWGEAGWFPRRGLYDMPTILVASLIVTVIAMIVAGPLGLGSAIYLSEYASRRTRAVLKPVLEVLAGVPSVVLGFFALFFISPQLIERIGRNGWLVMGGFILLTYVVLVFGSGQGLRPHLRFRSRRISGGRARGPGVWDR